MKVFNNLRIHTVEVTCTLKSVTCHSLPINLLLQFLQQLRSIFRSVLAVLFKLYDVISDEPVAHCLHAVYGFHRRRESRIMRGLDNGSQIVEGMQLVAPILKGKFHAVMEIC